MPKQRWFRLSSLGLFFILPLLLGGCAFDNVQSAMDPQGPIARQQISLLTYTMWLSALVVLAVAAVLFWAMFRYRERPGDDTIPVQSHGNTVVEIGLILLATVLTVIVVVPAVRTIFKTEYRVEATSEDVVINVTGYQWWWAFEYPELGLTTANEIHIPKGKRVVFNLSSADVLHSFWVPKLAGKRDLIPNQKNQLWFVTDENTPTGVYYGQCAELCLGAHAYMRFRVVVDTEEDYAAWVDKFQSIDELEASTGAAVQQIQADPMVQQGQALFKSKGCAACHAVKGFAGGAPDKPNLTKFGLRNTIASGVLDNTPENLARWLRDPQEVKPTNYMPTLWAEDDPNADEEIAAISAYLLSLGADAEEVQANLGGAYGN